jgi:hypothetical protein
VAFGIIWVLYPGVTPTQAAAVVVPHRLSPEAAERTVAEELP